MNFVLDGMLGKLARWLRMMGHDVKYTAALSDGELLSVAKQENRILLTRDRELFQRAASKNIDSCYVSGVTEPERIAEIALRFGIPLAIDISKSRCPKCNSKIIPIAKEEIADKVEEKTLMHYHEFWCCSSCGAIYWQGSHLTKIQATLKEAKQIVEKKRKLS